MSKTSEFISNFHGGTGVAIMILDNATSHGEEKIIEIGSFKLYVVFLPANTTSLIQPVDHS